MGNSQIVLTKNIFLNIAVAFLIPLTGYYVALIIAPKKDKQEIVEAKEIKKILKRINKKKEKLGILKNIEISLLGSPNKKSVQLEKIKKDLESLEEKTKKLKEIYNHKSHELETKYFATTNNIEKIVFYVFQILALLTFLLSIFFPIKPIKAGTIMAGLICLAFSNIYYWAHISDFMKILQVVFIIVFIIIMGYKLKLTDKIKSNKKSRK